MDAHSEVVRLLDQLRDRAKVFSVKTREEFDSISDSIETITRAYMVPDAPFDWKPFGLTPKESRFLDLLYVRMGKIVPRHAIYENLYSSRAGDECPEMKVIDVFASKIRAKLLMGQCPYQIQTEWSIGYSLVKLEDWMPAHHGTKTHKLRMCDAIATLKALKAA